MDLFKKFVCAQDRYGICGSAGTASGKAIEKLFRNSTDPDSWIKQLRQLFHTSDIFKAPSPNNKGNSRQDCPLDKSKLGGCTWGLLHSVAAFYPDNPTDVQKDNVKMFFDTLTRVYPCEFCARDFQADFKQNPIKNNSQPDLAQWLCQFHNRVNQKLNKPKFDCSKIDERWRDGWMDGSCDG